MLALLHALYNVSCLSSLAGTCGAVVTHQSSSAEVRLGFSDQRLQVQFQTHLYNHEVAAQCLNHTGPPEVL